MKVIHPVILSGGSGTRLWPLSREAYPKQLLALFGSSTMLQATVLRAMALAGEGITVKPPLLICNQEHRFLVREQCLAMHAQPEAIYLEPAGRNTAPAIALAALHLARGELADPDALMLVMPADHFIRDQQAFANAVLQAAGAAQQDWLVTFGITPTYAETGYGYIKAGTSLPGLPAVARVAQFVEKPTQSVAQQFLAAGAYSWNSGMFLFKAGRYLEELGKFRPDMLQKVSQAFEQRSNDLGFWRPEQHAFLQCPADSIDYAVMQPTQSAVVVQADIGWSDVGSWESLWQMAEHDASGNSCQGDVFALNTSNSYLRAENRQLSVIGLDNVVVVETRDVVLVLNKNATQDVKLVVEHLRKQGRSESLLHTRVYRPWGWYEEMDHGEGFKVKRLQVNAGEKLSLQLHHRRAEHWVVVKGRARVTVGETVSDLLVNQSVYIPVGSKHRLENLFAEPLQIIEVQSGSYLGEDDIVRLEDIYQRQ